MVFIPSSRSPERQGEGPAQEQGKKQPHLLTQTILKLYGVGGKSQSLDKTVLN